MVIIKDFDRLAFYEQLTDRYFKNPKLPKNKSSDKIDCFKK